MLEYSRFGFMSTIKIVEQKKCTGQSSSREAAPAVAVRKARACTGLSLRGCFAVNLVGLFRWPPVGAFDDREHGPQRRDLLAVRRRLRFGCLKLAPGFAAKIPLSREILGGRRRPGIELDL